VLGTLAPMAGLVTFGYAVVGYCLEAYSFLLANILGSAGFVAWIFGLALLSG